MPPQPFSLQHDTFELAEKYYNLYLRAHQQNLQVLKLLAELKAEKVTLDRLIVSDDGYQVLPPPPEESNGASMEPIPEEATA